MAIQSDGPGAHSILPVEPEPPSSSTDLWRRRLGLASVIAFIMFLSIAGLFPTLWEVVDNMMGHAQELTDRSPDRRLRMMIDAGEIRPARSSDVAIWLAAAGVASEEEVSLYAHDSFVVLKPVTLPGGMHGANSRSFLVPRGVPIPQDQPDSHNNVYLMASGTCLGFGTGCTR